MFSGVLKICKKMKSADIKTEAKKENNKKINKRTGSCILKLFSEVPSQNLKYNVKQACSFIFILVGIPSSLILSFKNRR